MTMHEEIAVANRKYERNVLGIINRLNSGDYPSPSIGFDDQERARQNHLREIMDIHRRYAERERIAFV